MTDSKFTVEFGRPEERAHFVGSHERFFERFDELQKALDAAFIRAGAPAEILDIAVIALGTLCVEDFSEILLQSANGFGRGALKTLRGMYERLVVARYLHLHPEQAEAFWDYHIVKLSKMGLGDLLDKIDQGGKIMDRFRSAGAGGGRKRVQSSWSSLDFVKMAEEVGLGAHVRDAYRLSLEFAHPSVTSILMLLEADGGSLTVKDVEPERGLVEITFPMAHFFLLEVLRLQVEHFGLDDPVFKRCIDSYVYVWGRGDRHNG